MTDTKSGWRTAGDWINRAFGVVALWFAAQYLGDAIGGVGVPASAIKGTVWILIALIMLAPDLWKRVRPRKR